jgi:hypothetical protein
MKSVSSLLRATAVCIGLAISAALPAAIFAQDLALNDAIPSAPTVSSSASAPAPAATALRQPVTPSAIPSWENTFDRWFDLNSLNYGARYRSALDVDGAKSFTQGQERFIADGKFKFDRDGRYGIGFHLSSGRYFNWAYSSFVGGGQTQFITNTELNMTPTQLYIMNVAPFQPGFFNSDGAVLYFRQAYLTAQPIKGIEVQFGGLGIDRGVNTEATSYDDDGYITGERISVSRPKQLFFSEISFTRAYIGDMYTPDFFDRGERLAVSNYHQYLARKDFGTRVAVSADYTYSEPQFGAFYLRTVREAIAADVHESKIFDKVRYEAYQRLNSGNYATGYPFPSGRGSALTVSKDFKNHFSIEGGVADIDLNYITNLGLDVQALILGLTVNGDQYGVGNRWFVRPTIPLNKSVSLVAGYSHLYSVGVEPPVSTAIWNAQALTAGFVVDGKKLFFHSKPVR